MPNSSAKRLICHHLVEVVLACFVYHDGGFGLVDVMCFKFCVHSLCCISGLLGDEFDNDGCLY
jgi:hypothetical protein